MRRKKIALAMGGGAARGIANIGVLKALEREGIRADLLVGSSMGALVAASYSAGMSLKDLEEEAAAFTWHDIADVTLSRIAFTKGEKLKQIVERLTGGKGFSDCRIPLYVTATAIESGEEVLFSSGDLAQVVRASCSWPGFFPPVEVDGQMLCDGGIRNSVPVKWARQLGGEFVIAVKVGFAPQKIEVGNVFQLMTQSIQIMGEELDKYQSMNADVVIEPGLEGVNQLDFQKSRDIIRMGELACMAKMPYLKKGMRAWKFL
ncbi:MAG: patatin-like phospholipase family protein [Candidatus Omnitrophota bacterium]